MKESASRKLIVSERKMISKDALSKERKNRRMKKRFLPG